MNKKILIVLALIGVLFLSGCNETPKRQLVDMDCIELRSELSNRPHSYIRDNELYLANVIEIMKMKKCDLK